MNLRTHIFAVGVFLAVFGFTTHRSHSQTIPGGTMILGPVSTVDPGDTYPTHWAEFGKGGWRSAGNWAELNAIPAERIENGMSVWQVDSNRWFIRISGAWTAFEPSGTLETIADLTNSIPSAGFVLKQVLGFYTPGDWGSPRDFWWDATNTLPASPIRLASALTPTGRWINGWNDRNVMAWGVLGSETIPEASLFQSVIDYVESETNLGLSGGIIRVPDRIVVIVDQTIQMRNGVSIIASSDRNADRGFPMDQTAPRFVAAPGLRAPIFEFSDYTNASPANPRMIVLKGLVFDGNFDAQSTNDLALVGISLRSTLAKNISIEGCAFYDTPGYSIFAVDGFNAGTIRDCFLGNGLFATVSADLKISDTDITGRTRGSLAAGTPYPPIWLGPFSQKNQFSDVMVYMGPRAEVGFDNSLRRWSISSADSAANTLTIATTNGIFDGLPVVWRSGGSLPSGVQTNQLYHVLWSGSATIQLASSSGYRTRTALDFGAVTLSSDVLQMGEAAMIYTSGGSSVAQNAFSNIRVEDSYGDLIHLDGAHDNAFSNPMLGFSYTNTGRFVRLTRGAQGNTFSGGIAAWNYPNQFGEQPQTIVEIDAESRANRFQGVRMSNASVQTVIDRNVTEPGNVWDYEEPSAMWMRGLDASMRFWDFNSVVTNTMWWNGNSVFWTLDESDPLNTYDWGFDGSNQILEIHGSSAPGVRIQGYNASSAPALTLRNKGGTRAAPAQTAAGATLGAIFFAGRDTSADTSARAAITAVTPSSGWPSTTDTPAELWFAVTPDGSATRTNLFGIQGDLSAGDTPLMVSVGGSAPQRVKKDAGSGALYIGSYSGGSGGSGTNDFTGQVVTADAFRRVLKPLGAGTVLTNNQHYTVTLAADRTVTFAGTPADGDEISLYVTASSGVTMTFPSSVDGSGGGGITNLYLVTGRHELSWTRKASEWVFLGTGLQTAIDGSAAGLQFAPTNAAGVRTYSLTVTNAATLRTAADAQQSDPDLTTLAGAGEAGSRKFMRDAAPLAALDLVPAASTNMVLDFGWSVATYNVTNNVFLLQSTNRPAASTNAAFTTVRLVGDSVDRTLGWHSGWKRLGTNITTIPAGKTVLLSAMVIGSAESGVVIGLAKEE